MDGNGSMSLGRNGGREAQPPFKSRSVNLGTPSLYEEALRRAEARLSRDGALVVDTGQHTGRSPKDKVIVRDADTEQILWWANNGAISREAFELLRADVTDYMADRHHYVQQLFAGAHPGHRVTVSVHTELAWHSLFIRNLLIRPLAKEVSGDVDLTIIAAPGFRAVPARYGVRSETVIACDFTNRGVLIVGTSYAGEMKKAVFTFLNYVLPTKGVMPMHCSANVGPDGDSAIFFGLSGTGKTTLSATADRTLVGDDEHGWGPDGIFNFEGGCYAKTLRLSPQAEPQIYAATGRFGTVLENVPVSDITGAP